MHDKEQRSAEDIRRLVSGHLTPEKAAAVRRAVVNDEERLRLYDRLVQAERALEGQLDADGLGDGAKARIASRLFESPADRRWAPLFRVWPIAPTALAAALAAVTLVPWSSVRSTSEEFTERGPLSVETSKLSPDRVLQVLRVEVGATGNVSVAPAEVVDAGDHLRFAVFVAAGKWKVSILAARADGRRTTLSVRQPVVARASAQRLNVAFRVPEDWRGPVKFVGVFERAGKVDLQAVDTQARDEQDLSVRVVTATVGGGS